MSEFGVRKSVTIYSDGACTLIKNPDGTYAHGPGGAAIVVPASEDSYYYSYSSKAETTNNEMELKAIEKALRYCIGRGYKNTDILLYSDSAYSINIFTQWIEGWKAKGWTRGKNKPIENLGLIKEIDYFLRDLKKNNNAIQFIKVKGHSGNKWNEVVDELAVKAKITQTSLSCFSREVNTKEGN